MKEATAYIQEFLDIVQKYMLLIEKEDRKESKDLVPKFERLHNKCKNGTKPAYHMKSAPGDQVPDIGPLPIMTTSLSPEFMEGMRRSKAKLSSYKGETRVPSTAHPPDQAAKLPLPR
jgi:hypothetical protein